jgi:FMN phosphatase YigB (HAD superfamily)
VLRGRTLVSSVAAWRKPSPEMLRIALSRLGGTVAEFTYIGDMASDEQAARSLGCRYLDAEKWRMG